MIEIRFIANLLNCMGYFLWSFSILNFVEQLLNDNFNFRNINSFLSMLTAIIALVFAFYKLKAYIRDSKIKSKILEQELIEKQNENFYHKWDHEFNEKKD